jgi:hypothetical protein
MVDRQPDAGGNGPNNLERIATQLMDLVGQLQIEIRKNRTSETGDGDDDTTRADRPGEEHQRGS